MTDLPHAVWSGVFRIWGVTLHCHVLSTGERVIDAGDIEALFARRDDLGDVGDLEAMMRWQRGQD